MTNVTVAGYPLLIGKCPKLDKMVFIKLAGRVSRNEVIASSALIAA
jgi:hypothetical protein